MIVLSALMHGSLVAWIALLGFEPPRPHAPHVGKASIALRASVASRPASAEKEVQQIPDPALLPPIEQPKSPPPIPAPPTPEKITRAPLPASLPSMKFDPLLHVPPEIPNLPALAMTAPSTALVGPLSGPKETLARPKSVIEKLPELRPEKSVLPPADVPKLDLTEFVSNPKLPFAKTEKIVKEQVTRSSKKAEVLPKLEPDTQVAAVLSLPSPASQAAQGADELPQKSPSNPAPPYPSDALAIGREGKVMLRVAIDASGRVTAISVYESSGFASLDSAALSTVQRWSFSPARRFGQPIPFEFRVPIEFSIRRRFSS